MTNNTENVWSVRRCVYHRSGCRWAGVIAKANRREGPASEAGPRRPCKCCHRVKQQGGPKP